MQDLRQVAVKLAASHHKIATGGTRRFEARRVYMRAEGDQARNGLPELAKLQHCVRGDELSRAEVEYDLCDLPVLTTR